MRRKFSIFPRKFLCIKYSLDPPGKLLEWLRSPAKSNPDYPWMVPVRKSPNTGELQFKWLRTGRCLSYSLSNVVDPPIINITEEFQR
jgi:hypothetical protein